MRCWARRSRAAATIFMARVIFCVFFTDAMRRRMTLRLAIQRAPASVT
jgi:predicted membrane-bound mannosyltransferase